MSTIQLAQQSHPLIEKLQQNKREQLAYSRTAVVQTLHYTPQLATYYVAERPQNRPAAFKQERQQFLDELVSHFNEGDLRDLCFDLAVDYESLAADGAAGKARELYLYMERHNRLTELVELVAQERPQLFQLAHALPRVAKTDLAIIVDLTKRPIVQDVAAYLEEEGGVEADLLLCQSPGRRHIRPGHWNNFPKTFFNGLQDGLAMTQARQFHIFISAPGTIAFALGCMWGTVKNATLYHFDGDQYSPEIDLSRGLQK